jgi:hypothetical protein
MAALTDSWTKASPYDRFAYFIAIKVDRFKTLQQTIDKMGLRCLVMQIEKNKHFFIFPPTKKIPLPLGSALPPMGPNPYMLVAHYDRVEGSPGANDNSIAVFHLLKAATMLAQRGLDNWIILFTDKEELTSGESFEAQGSFALAQKLKSWGLDKARVFNFDACGTGDTFIFSNIADTILSKSSSPNIQKVKQDIMQLRYHALETANMLRYDKVLMAPTPFCDDMGFLRAGIAAQTITMLPSDETAQFSEVLRKYPEFTDMLIAGGIKDSNARRFFPNTWKNLNGPADTVQRLTSEHFENVVRFMVELCSR